MLTLPGAALEADTASQGLASPGPAGQVGHARLRGAGGLQPASCLQPQAHREILMMANYI